MIGPGFVIENPQTGSRTVVLECDAHGWLLEGTCQPCTATAQCGVDPDFGECVCQQSANGTAVCNPPADQVEVASCAACPPNTNCFAGFGGFVRIAACRTA